ncbi:vWA domain-containing protein [Propionivibrio sp.]|uniref:vWA domain-containing protein n=1 Tax=Propionivibrio sp. TaxID=2212460 RepID=UPI003BF05E6E
MMPNNNTPQVLITPLKPALILGHAQKLPVLVRVQAPDSDPAQKKVRKPYHLSLVIDRSGSMSGEPLMEAVRCAGHIIDRLNATDIASLIVFDDHVNTLVPARPVSDRKVLYAALAKIRSGGSTNLYGGWKAGMESLLPAARNAALARVILLSDGNANVGETEDSNEIAAFCAEATEKGVSTSTYGLGSDFNEALMVEMGKRGAGNHYYGDTAADLFEPFAEEFDFISSLYARHVRLSLSAPQGVKITLLNDYPVEERDGFPLIRLPDIPLGAEAWVLVELEIPAGLALESGNQFLQAEVTATTPEGEPLAFRNESLTLQAMSLPAWDTLLPDPLVLARQAEVAAGSFLDKARSAAEQGDWETIQKMIAEGRTRFADNPWVMEVLEGLAELARTMDGARFRKEAMYTSRKMGSRVSAKDEVLGSTASEAAMPSFLRRKKMQGKAQFGPRPEDGPK